MLRLKLSEVNLNRKVVEMEKERKVEFTGRDKDGTHLNGMIRSDSNSILFLKEAVRRSLQEAGFDVVSVEIMGIVPMGESAVIQNAMHGGVK